VRSVSPPSELTRSAPREVRLTSAGIVLLAISWVLGIAAVPLGMLLYAEARQDRDVTANLASRGVQTAAVVDRLWREEDDGSSFRAAVYFDAGGSRIYGERRMQQSAWKRLSVGSTTTVRHLPEDPQRWVLAGERRDRLPVPIAFVISGIMISVAVICGAVVRWQRSLLQDGRPAPGVVTAFSMHKTTHGAAHREVRYEFPLLGGGKQTGKSSVSKPAAVGDAIWVVYDPDRPKRNKPYPFSLVRTYSS